MSELLKVEGLSTVFPGTPRDVPVVDDLSFTIDEGEVLALVGESGCGKSMTALSVMRLVPKPGRIDRGTIVMNGRDVRGLSIPEIRKLRGHEISMIFQEPMTSLNPVVTVGKQVVEAIQLHEAVDFGAARKRTIELFERVGIPDAAPRFDVYPHQLSGGLKQRVMIAMALSTRPKLLIADEPTTALDVTIQAQILELLRDLQRDTGMSILLITHDLGVVNELSDRVSVMYAGRVVEHAEREELFGRPVHPYSIGLLRSNPALSRPGEPLPEIPGVVPPPDEWPEGCRFANRCDRVLEVCGDEIPGATVQGPHKFVCCHAIAREGADD
ncbi:MAG: ABC transporter ATP-binding protein [Myxococcota bacterium]|nr:ABC transporter ATP-binding protein [Myxococcota bacterium]